MTPPNHKNKDTLEDFFSSTFFLYPKWPGGEPCGCAGPRETWLAASTAGSCPLCGASDKVVAVLDGYTHSLETDNSYSSNEKEQDRPKLMFKHGSLTYQVALPPQKPQSSSSRLLSFSLFGWFVLGGQRDASYFAQNHLAYILGLELSESKMAVIIRANLSFWKSDQLTAYVHQRFFAGAKSSFPRLQQLPRIFRINWCRNPRQNKRRQCWWSWEHRTHSIWRSQPVRVPGCTSGLCPCYGGHTSFWSHSFLNPCV